MVRRAAQAAQAGADDTNMAMRVALASQAMQDALLDAIEAAETLPGEKTTTQAERGRALTFGEIMALMAVCQADPSPGCATRQSWRCCALADWRHLQGLKPGALFARIDRVAGGGHAIARDPESGQPLGLTDQAIYYRRYRNGKDKTG